MNEEKRKQRAFSMLDSYLVLNRKRRTRERSEILDAALGLDSPFGLEELERKVVTGGFHVSRATVYNAMSLFAEAGLARKVRLEGRSELWEMADPTAGNLKIRLVCSHCGKVREQKDAELSRQLSLRRYTSFTPSFFELYVNGICSRCRRNLGKGRKINKA